MSDVPPSTRDATPRRVALVTGSSRGLGRAAALELARRGHPVAVHYVHSEGPAQEVAERIRAAGGEAAVFAADVADPDACADLVKRVTGELGSLDVLVNNAGITRDGLVLRMKTADWQAVLDTNLGGPFHLAKGALRGMMRSGFGRIVNITSVVALMGTPGQANYVSAKAGLIGLTKSLAREYASKGITVNAVAPGFIESDMTAELPDATQRDYLEQIPLARFGAAEDVAHAVAFLASDEAGYITGQTLAVDGGLSMR